MEKKSNFYILINNDIFESCKPNIDIEDGISFQNIKTKKFLRHYCGNIVEDDFLDINIFKYDSTFIKSFKDNFLTLRCSNRNLNDRYVNLDKNNNTFIISKNKKYEFYIYKKIEEIYSNKIIYENIKDIHKKIYNINISIEKMNKIITEIKENIYGEIDVTQIPKAQGVLRILQEVNALFLAYIVKIFEKHNLTYWLYGGTLLGSYRHQGFIPWDDDIDIGMLRDDYEKLQHILKSEFISEKSFYFTKGDAIRVFYKETPLQIDIFPFDIYPKYLFTDKEREELKCNMRQNYKKIKFDWSKCKSGNNIINLNDKDIKNMINSFLNVSNNDKNMIITGLECCHRKALIFDYDWIFPLKKIAFEEYFFNSPSQIELVLFENFGNYMEIPSEKKIHFDLSKISSLTIYNMLKFKEIYSKNIN